MGTVFIVIIGGIATGKSTAAQNWQREDPGNRYTIEKDEIRERLGIGGNAETNTGEETKQINDTEMELVRQHLEAGIHVLVADTCQYQEQMNRWHALAQELGVELAVWDLRPIPIPVCIRRARSRAARRAYDASAHLPEPERARRAAEASVAVDVDAVRRVATRCAEVQIPAGVPTVTMGW